MPNRTLLLLVFAAALANSFWSPVPVPAAHSTRKPDLINIEEAEILIFLLPQAAELRRQGMDVGWELQTGPKLNQADFYTFWVVNSSRPHVEGSVTVGYFGVNKHSAEVWSLDKGEFVSAPEIGGVQRIIRRAHSIDDALVRKYHSRRPDVLSGPSDNEN